MDANAYFEPNLTGFVGYCAGFFLRYVTVAGGLFLLLHVLFPERWAPWRIQPEFPTLDKVWYELRWSAVNTACTGLSTLLLYALIRDGATAMYFDIGARGWAWWFCSAFLCIAGYDTWIYWQHRALHTDWLFRHVHSVHHRLLNPSGFAAFAQHPVETFMGNLYFILFLLLVPIHPTALAAAGAYMFAFGVLAHSGYEFYPYGFTRHPVLGWLSTSTNHNLHHRDVRCNYGNWFTYWDRFMGTLHPQYHDIFDTVAARGIRAGGILGRSRRRAEPTGAEAGANAALMSPECSE